MMKRWLIGLVMMVGVVAVGQGRHAQMQNSDPRIDFYYTYQNADGNRVVEGRSSFPDVQAYRVPLSPEMAPIWVVGANDWSSESVYIVTALENGVRIRHEFNPTADGLVYSTSEQGSAGPLVMAQFSEAIWEGGFMPRTPPLNPAEKSHAVLASERVLVYLDTDGAVVTQDFWTGEAVGRYDGRALPDTRLVVNEGGQVAFYSQPTTRYPHAIAGDDLEGGSLTILGVNQDRQLTLVQEIILPETEVFEGIMPFWADINSDGVQDLVTTVSDAENGARIRVYGIDEAIIAETAPIGQGFRWRHVLAWGPFGVAGENLLVEVKTPHIGGVVVFHRYVEGQLLPVAEVAGYSTHTIGSNNMDMAAAGDFNGDGVLEIVVPDQAQERLYGLQLENDVIIKTWVIPLEGTLTTNLHAVNLYDGRLGLVAGMRTAEGGVLGYWRPTN